jgi:hypothetical protein
MYPIDINLTYIKIKISTNILEVDKRYQLNLYFFFL